MNEKMVKVSGHTHKLLVEMKEESKKENKRDSIGSIVDRLVEDEHRRAKEKS
jgi:hypothetical protein